VASVGPDVSGIGKAPSLSGFLPSCGKLQPAQRSAWSITGWQASELSTQPVDNLVHIATPSGRNPREMDLEIPC
jgi:hypothetical protein